MAFQNLPISMTLPTGAGRGQSRIVIGPKLPPPLDTYQFQSPGGSPGIAAGAILFYQATPSDDDYIFLAMVNHAGLQHSLWLGAVLNGVVIETNGFASAFRYFFNGGGGAITETLTDLMVQGPSTFSIIPQTRAGHTYQNFNIDVATAAIGDVVTEVTFPSVDAGILQPIRATHVVGSGSIQIHFGTYRLAFTGSTKAVDRQIAPQNVLSGTYTNSAVICGTPFTAPPSGSVTINFAAEMGNATAGTFNLTTIRIGTGTTLGAGTVFQAASDDVTLRIQGGSGTFRTCVEETVTGLTAGDTYNVVQQHRSSSAASTLVVARRYVAVTPNWS